ncbi:MAG: rhomboid family intramembrane serine protease [Verrucomicrobiales bacterium]|nr:rhomboid family intramembrane serine protease [Verrucomicrobiales bacterium]
MRFIGHLDNQALAEQLGYLLRVHGIQNLVEPDDDRRWSVWIIAEDDTDRARQLLGAFRSDPEHPSFRIPPILPSARPSPAPEPRPAPETREPRRASPRALRALDLQDHLPWATAAIVLLCGAVGIVTGLGVRQDVLQWLKISLTPYRWGAPFDLFLPEVRQGQVWRLLSPAVLHFGWPHILFNLWAFWDLSGLIERRSGPNRLVGLVVGLALFSNLGQYFYSGPNFGGMSGVVYGLLGYAWMMGKFRPEAGIGLHPQTVVMMLVWFVICLTPALGVPVANAAHGYGLAAGILWGRLQARLG